MLTLLYLFILILLTLLVRSKMKSDAIKTDEKDKSEFTVIEANTFETGHSSTYLVTKDPEAYARIFVPPAKRRKDR